MALSKPVQTESGVAATYHNVANYNFIKGQGFTLTVEGFASAETRAAGCQPLASARVSIPLADVDLAQPLLPQFYAKLKAAGAFAGAEDC